MGSSQIEDEIEEGVFLKSEDYGSAVFHFSHESMCHASCQVKLLNGSRKNDFELLICNDSMF